MSVKDGKDYLYLIWKCSSNRRQYIVGQLSKNGQYEFCYCEEFNEAVKEGFSPLISFEDTNRVYKSQELFPAFSSRLPDRKRKDINKILKTTTSFFTKHHYIWQNNCFSVLTKTDLL